MRAQNIETGSHTARLRQPSNDNLQDKQTNHEELIRRARQAHEQPGGNAVAQHNNYQRLRSKSPRGSRSPGLSSTRNEDNKVLGGGDGTPSNAAMKRDFQEERGISGGRAGHDESFNSQSNRDQKSLRLLNKNRGRQATTGGDRSNVNEILQNFNREKEQFNSKLQDLKNKLRTLSISP